MLNRVGHKLGRVQFQIGHGRNVSHMTPLEQICALKIFEVGLQTPPLPKTPIWPMGKAKIWQKKETLPLSERPCRKIQMWQQGGTRFVLGWANPPSTGKLDMTWRSIHNERTQKHLLDADFPRRLQFSRWMLGEEGHFNRRRSNLSS